MNVELIDIGGILIPRILPFLILAIIIFISNIYVIFDRKLKSNVIFDIGFICIAGGIVFARILGILNDYEWYSNLKWQPLPFVDSTTGITFENSMPWQVINIFDQNFILWGFPLGVILTAFVLYFYSNKKKNILAFLDKILFALLPTRLVISIGNYVSTGYIDSEDNIFTSLGSFYEDSSFINIALFEIIILIVGIVFLLLFQQYFKEKFVLLGGYLILEGIIGIAIISETANISEISGIPWTIFVSALLILLGVVLGLKDLLYSIVKTNKKPPTSRVYLNGEDLLSTNPMSDIERANNKSEKIKKYFRWKN